MDKDKEALRVKIGSYPLNLSSNPNFSISSEEHELCQKHLANNLMKITMVFKLYTLGVPGWLSWLGV